MDAITENSIGLDGVVFRERRDGRRQKVLKHGVISFNRNMDVLDCVVRNESVTGATLYLNQADALPDEFNIMILPSSRKCTARVRWRSGDRVGVSFE
ncbi:MAG: PilZ domain-containing protein [Rhizobiaceae bacterium]|nr:PilZ domain-containing protein [Rhizobiaceae bacterium]